MRSSLDSALGAMLGAFVGDAAGAVLEFARKVDAELVEQALQMPGGGVFKVGEGQITDDSELALALASGLSTQDPANGFPEESVALAYGRWLESAPFDIGNTCRTAFSAALHHDAAKAGPLSQVMRKQAQFSHDSQANGALMRITPLAVWGHRLSDAALAEAAAADARLSHPHPVCQATNAIYCIAIKRLIEAPGDAEGAIAAASAWAAAHASPDVQAWLRDAVGCTAPGPPANRMIGFVKYGFFYAFRHLSLRTPYRDALREVLLLGGDTDTNAAIVGGLVGALHGAAAVPPDMARPVLSRHGEPELRGPRRPAWLQSGRLPAVFARLYERATGEAPALAELPGVPAADAAAAAARAALAEGLAEESEEDGVDGEGAEGEAQAAGEGR